jgi:hypothetical protein
MKVNESLKLVCIHAESAFSRQALGFFFFAINVPGKKA